VLGATVDFYLLSAQAAEKNTCSMRDGGGHWADREARTRQRCGGLHGLTEMPSWKP